MSKIDGHIAVEDEEGYWEVLKEWPDGLVVNLIELENVSMLLGLKELAPNKYTQLRIFLKEEATLVLESDDEPVPLEIPSSANNGKYKLKPVIHVTSETYSEEDFDTGTVSGIVLEDSETGPPISGATVSAALSGSAYIFSSSAVTDEDGLFLIEQLPVGTYDLNAVAVGYVEETVNGIVVESAATTSGVNIILTSDNP